MEQLQLTHSPFAVLTLIAAPALLTNATSVLAMSTINRMLRTRDRMHEMFAQSASGELSEKDSRQLLDQVSRVEKQAVLLLQALHSIYVSLGAFSGATLVTLLGAAFASFEGALWFRGLAGFGLFLGFIGVGGLVFGSINLFQATQLSLVGIRQEAAIIRARQKEAAERKK